MSKRRTFLLLILSTLGVSVLGTRMASFTSHAVWRTASNQKRPTPPPPARAPPPSFADHLDEPSEPDGSLLSSSAMHPAHFSIALLIIGSIQDLCHSAVNPVTSMTSGTFQVHQCATEDKIKDQFPEQLENQGL